MRHISVPTFNGPLDLLLQLIEQEQLDITQISLAKVTEDYIAELQKLEELPVDELAEFLVVAAKLLLIKSRLMVPGDSGPADESATELERQLKMYKAFVDASKHVLKLYNRHRVGYPRDGYANVEPIFNPPPHLEAAHLRDLYATVLHELEPIVRLPETVIIRTMNIREKIAQVQARLLEQRRSSFHDLLKEATNRTEAIVTFLAVLELVKQRQIAVVQDDPYADVAIEVLDFMPEEPLSVTSL